MIISDTQARLAAEYLRQSAPRESGPRVCEVPSDVLAKAHEIACHAPDVREERLAEARMRLQADVSADEIASKMISRIVSDALRQNASQALALNALLQP